MAAAAYVPQVALGAWILTMAGRGRFAWDDGAGVAENARRNVPPLARAYFRAGRKLTAGEWSADAFHEFRLHTKRLRYTLELFRGCYGPALERYLAALSRVQDHLGTISDCAVTGKLVAGLLGRRSPHRRQFDGLLERRAKAAATQLRRYWRAGFDPPGQERRWVRYLSRPAHRK